MIRIRIIGTHSYIRILHLITAKIFSSRKMKYSSPSILISSGLYLVNKTVSPTFTDIFTLWSPSSFHFPSPTATTFPRSGFSLETLSGMKIPAFDLSSSSRMGLTKIRSKRGTTFCPFLFFFSILKDSIQKSLLVKLARLWREPTYIKALASASERNLNMFPPQALQMPLAE